MKNHLTVALVIPYYQNMFSTFYTLEIIKEVSSQAIEQGVDLLIETGWRKDGISGVLFADMMGNEILVKKARQKKLPYLILNYYDSASKDNCIGIDNGKASLEAVNYLIQAGHTRIAAITGKLNAQTGTQRLKGYKEALRSANIDLDKGYIVTGDWTKDSGRRAMEKLLSLKLSPTAVFAAGDEMAIGAMEAVRGAGLKVGEDISIVGFDNIPQTDSPQVALTTIEQPFAELARLGIEYLVQIIKKETKQPVQILLESTKLIRRKSVKDLSK